MSDPPIRPPILPPGEVPDLMTLEYAAQMAESYSDSQLNWLRNAPDFLRTESSDSLMLFECAQYKLLAAAAKVVSCPVCSGTGMLFIDGTPPGFPDCNACSEYRELIKRGIMWKELAE